KRAHPPRTFSEGSTRKIFAHARKHGIPRQQQTRYARRVLQPERDAACLEVVTAKRCPPHRPAGAGCESRRRRHPIFLRLGREHYSDELRLRSSTRQSFEAREGEK